MEMLNFLNFATLHSSFKSRHQGPVNIAERYSIIYHNYKNFIDYDIPPITNIKQDLNEFTSRRCKASWQTYNICLLPISLNSTKLNYVKDNIYVILNIRRLERYYNAIVLAFLNRLDFFNYYKLKPTNNKLFGNKTGVYIAVVVFLVKPELYYQILEYPQQKKEHYYAKVASKFKYNSFFEDVKTVFRFVSINYTFRHLNKEKHT